jgi:hypothetical protein
MPPVPVIGIGRAAAVKLGPVENATWQAARWAGCLERDIALVGDAPEAAKLAQRLGMVIDADVDGGEDLACPNSERC